MRGNLYVEMSGEIALEKRMDTVATNIANVNTGGYRAQGVAFSSVLSKVGERPASFVSTGVGVHLARAGRGAGDRQPVRRGDPGRCLVRDQDAPPAPPTRATAASR